MKRTINPVLTYGALTVIGAVLQEYAVEAAYAERGCWAIGGEWLVLPVCLMMGQLARSLRETLRSEDEDNV